MTKKEYLEKLRNELADKMIKFYKNDKDMQDEWKRRKKDDYEEIYIFALKLATQDF